MRPRISAILIIIIFLFSSIVSACSGLTSQTSLRTPVLPDPVVNAKYTTGESYHDQVYKTYQGLQLKLDIYLPTRAIYAKAPVVVYVHGGAWTSGDKATMGGMHNVDVALREAGFAVVSINYRMPPWNLEPFPGNIADTKDAVRWLRVNADQYGLDADRIGLMGNSAGSTLALLAAYSSRSDFPGDETLASVSPEVDYVINYYGVTDFVSLFHVTQGQGFTDVCLETQAFFTSACYYMEMMGLYLDSTPEETLAVLNRYSPVNYAALNDIPTLTLHGTQDGIVPLKQSELLDLILTENGIEHIFISYAGVGHNFEFAKESQMTDIHQQTVDFVVNSLK